MKSIKKIFLVSMLPLLLSSCASLNLASFDSSPNIIIEEDENRLWLRSEEDQERIATGGFLYEDRALTEYLNKVLDKVVPQEVRDTKLLFQVKIIKDPRVNAFCYPNGIIYVHTGILARMDNEAQLATVLGHEIAHAIKRHPVKQFRSLKNKTAFMNTFYLTSSGLGGSAGELVGILGQLGTIAAIYGYSREHEREADKYGFERMLAANYDINEAPRIFKHLKEDFDKEKKPDPFFFSSHPKLDERIESYNELITSVYAKEAQDKLKVRNEKEFILLTKNLLLDNAELDISLGRLETAKAMVEKYISNFSDNAQGYYYLGKVYTQKYQQPENKKLKEKITKEELKQRAIEYYKKAIAKDAAFGLSYRDLGILYFKDGNKPEAEEYFRRYITVCPSGKDKTYIENYIKECKNE